MLKQNQKPKLKQNQELNPEKISKSLKFSKALILALGNNQIPESTQLALINVFSSSLVLENNNINNNSETLAIQNTEKKVVVIEETKENIAELLESIV